MIWYWPFQDWNIHLIWAWCMFLCTVGAFDFFCCLSETRIMVCKWKYNQTILYSHGDNQIPQRWLIFSKKNPWPLIKAVQDDDVKETTKRYNHESTLVKVWSALFDCCALTSDLRGLFRWGKFWRGTLGGRSWCWESSYHHRHDHHHRHHHHHYHHHHYHHRHDHHHHHVAPNDGNLGPSCGHTAPGIGQLTSKSGESWLWWTPLFSRLKIEIMEQMKILALIWFEGSVWKILWL